MAFNKERPRAQASSSAEYSTCFEALDDILSELDGHSMMFWEELTTVLVISDETLFIPQRQCLASLLTKVIKANRSGLI